MPGPVDRDRSPRAADRRPRAWLTAAGPAAQSQSAASTRGRRSAQGAQPSHSAVADAAMRHDAAAVRTLLREGADVNTAQGDGMTALHWAATHGDAELADVLLAAGANVRATSRLNATRHSRRLPSGAMAVVTVLAGQWGRRDRGHRHRGDGADARRAAPVTPGRSRPCSTPRPTSTRWRRRRAVGADVAAAADRADVVRLLVARGATVGLDLEGGRSWLCSPTPATARAVRPTAGPPQALHRRPRPRRDGRRRAASPARPGLSATPSSSARKVDCRRCTSPRGRAPRPRSGRSSMPGPM